MKIRNLFETVSVYIACYLIWAFFIWFALVASYSAGHTDIKTSPAYNTPEQEVKITLQHLPIVALVLAVVPIYCSRRK
jgi:hypothetical protein